MVKLLFLLLTMLLSLQAIAQCPTLVWSDEFDGTVVNTDNWAYETGGGGWGNNELQSYTNRTENASVNGGHLFITAKEETYTGGDGITRNYTSARLKTQGKAYWTYGRFEVRAKVPQGQGIWPAIWMMPNESAYGSWPSSGEIDIMELLGHETNKTYGTIHYGTSFADHQHIGDNYVLPSGDFSSDFHVFAVEWNATSIRWLVDNVEFYSITKSEIAPAAWPFDKNFYFILNVAVGGNWPGSPNATTSFPQSMVVDYARVYQDMNGDQVSLKGASSVFENQEVGYSVPYKADVHYEWTLPSGAQLQSPEDSSRVDVRWGNTGGNISATYTTSCGTKTLEMPVKVYSGKCGVVYEDFEYIRSPYLHMSGTFVQDAINPDQAGNVNASPKVGKYTRSASQQYDVLLLGTSKVGNPLDYKNGLKKFSMDVYSTSPGINILLQLENRTLALQSFPSGRHSVYTATTSKTNEWETLTFTYQSTPDASAATIDQITLLIAPNTYTSPVLYLDNLYGYSTGACTIVTGIRERGSELHASVFPNPVKDKCSVILSRPVTGKLQLQTIEGIIIQETDIKNQSDISVPLYELSPGMYILLLETEYGSVRKKIVVE